MLLLMLAAAAAAPNPASIEAPRRNYAACIKQFETSSRASKMTPASYDSAVKGACSAEAEALTKALIAYDVAMGSKRATAAANAATDVEDYVLTSQERYRDLFGPVPQ